MTSRDGARTDANCQLITAAQANAISEHPPVRRGEMVNASLDTTVPVMGVPLASSSSGVIDFPRGG